MIDGVPHLVDCETSMREDGLPCGCITHDVVEAVMSSLSDHDRAVAADALRQAADSLDNLRDSNEYDDPYVRGITRAFHRGIDRSQERLRARAAAQDDFPESVYPITPGTANVALDDAAAPAQGDTDG